MDFWESAFAKKPITSGLRNIFDISRYFGRPRVSRRLEARIFFRVEIGDKDDVVYGSIYRFFTRITELVH